MAHVLNNEKLMSLDDLFKSTGNGLEDASASQVVEIQLHELKEFKGHPFKILDDVQMDMLVESIKDIGVTQPGIARKLKTGGYEIIEGHRRHRACELAGFEAMPFRIVDWDDDTATAYMTLSNLTQRKEFLTSEKAMAYRRLRDALEHQGKKGMLTAARISEEFGDSESTVKRLIRLSYLITPMLDLIDMKKLGLDQGKNLSYLSEEQQKLVYAVIVETDATITMEQAQKIRECASDDSLTADRIKDILSPEIKQKKRSFTMKQDILDGYFSSDYTNEEIREVIISLLEDWKAVHARG